MDCGSFSKKPIRQASTATRDTMGAPFPVEPLDASRMGPVFQHPTKGLLVYGVFTHLLQKKDPRDGVLDADRSSNPTNRDGSARV